MLTFQAGASRYGSARCCMAWFGYPPGSGQSALTVGFGRLIAIRARLGSGLSSRSRLSTEIRSPGSGCFLLANQLHPESAKPTSNSGTTAAGRNIARLEPGLLEPGLRGKRRRHLGRPGAHPARRRQIVGELLVESARVLVVAEARAVPRRSARPRSGATDCREPSAAPGGRSSPADRPRVWLCMTESSTARSRNAGSTPPALAMPS